MPTERFFEYTSFSWQIVNWSDTPVLIDGGLILLPVDVIQLPIDHGVHMTSDT